MWPRFKFWLLIIVVILGLRQSRAVLGEVAIKNQAAIVGTTASATPQTETPSMSDFQWRYLNEVYEVTLTLSEDLYQAYQGSSHFLSYRGEAAPDNWRESFYAMFLKTKPEDKFLPVVLNQLQTQAVSHHLSDDQLVELVMSFVQSIPYDNDKLNNKNNQVNYPYETLYKQTGVCSDKAVLAYMLLRSLGYGAAILVYPEKDHATVGVACPAGYTLSKTDYCYAETTNFFPIGFVPQSLDAVGRAVKTTGESDSQFDRVFSSDFLGEQQIYQAASGKIYGGIVATYQKIDQLKSLEKFINLTKPKIGEFQPTIKQKLNEADSLQTQLDQYKKAGAVAAYNNLLPTYNRVAAEYNDLVSNYQINLDSYNHAVNQYEAALNHIYTAGP